MSESKDRLNSALKGLAAAAPAGAPPELAMMLKDAFRAHHARRRRTRRILGAAVAVSLSAMALFLVRARPWVHDTIARDSTIASNMAQAVPTSREDADAGSKLSEPSKQLAPRTGNTSPRPRRPRTRAEAAFTPLPTYDPVYGTESFQIVRVSLPNTSFSQLGLPVREDSSGRRFLADLLVDRDGIPQAVRFVDR